MPLYRAVISIAWLCIAALALGACKNESGLFDSASSDSGLFTKKIDIFAKPDWAKGGDGSSNSKTLEPVRVVGADDLVGADGRCAGLAPAQDPAATGAVGDDQPVAQPAVVQPTLGGIALGMTECETVRRAGMPTQLNISAGEKGERQAVLMYAPGTPWPGIYKFSDGRLREVERVAEPEPPKKEPPKKKGKKPAKPKTAQPATRSSVQ